MRIFRYLFAFLTTAPAVPVAPSRVAAAPLETERATVDPAIYDELVLYAKYCAASYQPSCPKPMGNPLVETIINSASGTFGIVVRDDKRKEIVLAFRGTSDFTDIMIDLMVIRVPLESQGLTGMGSAEVHSGFLHAFNSVVSDVLRVVRIELSAHPTYRLIVTGHSLGGALASLAGISIRATLPQARILLYTFGQPRTGNEAFARYVEERIGVNNIFRVTHTWDGVPNIFPRFFGYEHFGTEYWNFSDPPSPATVRQCNGREDSTCSASTFPTPTSPPHIVYFNQVMLPLLSFFKIGDTRNGHPLCKHVDFRSFDVNNSTFDSRVVRVVRGKRRISSR